LRQHANGFDLIRLIAEISAALTGDFWLALAFSTSITFALALMSAMFIERPALRLKVQLQFPTSLRRPPAERLAATSWRALSSAAPERALFLTPSPANQNYVGILDQLVSNLAHENAGALPRRFIHLARDCSYCCTA
jgi:hypothetical protein